MSSSKAQSRRFVVLRHDHPFLHWDLMLEVDGVLRTWRLSAEPDTLEPIPAEPLPDHRLAYLEYEGPVSGNRGRVDRWDAGVYEWIDPGEPRFTLAGGRLVGTFRIVADTNGERFHFRRCESREA